MGRKEDVPGNVLASQSIFQRSATRLAVALDKVEMSTYSDNTDDIYLVAIRIVVPVDDGGDWMAVLTADGPEGAIVAFHRAGALGEVLRGMSEKFANKSLRWKKDEYRSE